ncbi:MAG: hypothetical protein ACLTBD_01760 [Clostridia bacterium]|uniref:NADH dehydrogenase subunit 4L n=1 Tax=Maccoyibacter intestinihominis TaxID=3133499 RepID=A0ABV1HDB9_9FIRM|nr:hypothetical protein [Lachnospiraceae bacterium]MEE0037892.1 hypothetical protein [Lachnospiraceae bacterium]MEE0512711.1 hypothetical protein [Lachnospiraceae bacterium]
MKRVCGFGLFCCSLGMILILLIGNEIIGFILVFLCLIIGYNLFCCR